MAAARRTFTDAYLKSLKPARKGARYAVSDALCPGLRLRVTDRGTKTFIVWRRFGGAPNPSARSIGEVGSISLTDARKKAREWIELAKAGNDPARIEARHREVAAYKAASTFGRAMERYLKHIASQRRATATTADIMRDLMPFWRDKPLHEFTRKDIAQRVREIAERAPYQAHAAFSNVRTFFNWARASEEYGLETVPTDAMRPTKLIGVKKPRQRVLSDDELFAFWRAVARIPYPLGPLFKLLLLTGARKSEIAEARWREINLRNAVLTIPAERFKSDSKHLIPLSRPAVEIFSTLPRWDGGDFVFSHDGGQSAANIWSKVKNRVDRRMKRTLRALARKRGENPADVELPHFVIHDLRRTVRTRLSSLRVSDTVAEMVIGHGRKGIQRVYDQHSFQEEMREALELWATLLSKVVSLTPPAENVVAFAQRIGERQQA